MLGGSPLSLARTTGVRVPAPSWGRVLREGGRGRGGGGGEGGREGGKERERGKEGNREEKGKEKG